MDPGRTELFRADFSYLESRNYLNSAAVGLVPSKTANSVLGLYESLLSRGMDARNGWLEGEANVRARIADLLGVSSGEVSFTSSTTAGLNLISLALALAEGDEVLVLSDDFISVRSAWRASSTGVRLVEAAHEEGKDRTQVLIDAIDSNTRVVAVSHVDPATGWVVDLERLGEACRQYDALLLVDGVQALGAIQVDLSAVDVYASACFKWMISGFGIAVLVVRNRARQRMTPAVRGYRNVAPSTTLEFAHSNYAGIFALEASLAYLSEVGFARVFARVDELSAALWDGLSAVGYRPVAPKNARAGIVTIPHRRAEDAVANLAVHGVSAAFTAAGVRFSPHFYNNAADIDGALAAVASVMPFSDS